MATAERFVASANIERFNEEELDVETAVEQAAMTDRNQPPPRDMPRINLDEKDETSISLFLQEQIHLAKSEWAAYQDNIDEIRKLYEMTELPESKDFPFENSAHLVIPLIATFTETIWAKLVNTLFTPSDIYATKPTKKEMVGADGVTLIDMNRAAKAIRRFLTITTKEEVKLKQFFTKFAMSYVPEGTGYAKTIYVVEDLKLRSWDPIERDFVTNIVRVKDHPEIIHVPFADLLYPWDTVELKDARWVAHRYTLTKDELDAKEMDEDWDNVDKLKAFLSKKRSTSEASRDRNTEGQSLATDTVEMYEVWFSHRLRGEHGDGKRPVRVVAQFHPDSGIIAKLEHNTYPLQKHPFDECVYIPRPHMVPGIGLGHMVKPFQNEISTMHNQRLDAGTIANAHVTLIKDDGTLPLDLKLKPGQTLAVSDPNEINVVSLGSKFDSTINEEKHTLDMVRNRVGIQDMQNMPLTGTSTQAILNMQESTKKFDIIVSGSREFLERIAEKLLLLYQQHYPDGKPVMVMGTDGEYIEEIFELSQNAIISGVGISVTATTSVTSKELERQSKLALLSALSQYHDKLAQYTQFIANPQMPAPLRNVAARIISGLSAFVEDILEDFNIQLKDELVISLDDITANQELATPVVPGLDQGAAPGVPGDAGQPGMADLQQALMAATGGGA